MPRIWRRWSRPSGNWKAKGGGRRNDWNGAIPWVKTAQIQNSIITPEYVDEWITQEGLEQSSARMVPKGTILMAMYGQGKTRGQVAILGLDAAINQACAAILLDRGADRDYVYQQLRFRYESIRALSNTGSQENLNAELIREIAFPLPGIDAQSEIAQVLGAWDTAIQKTEQLIAAKERHFAATSHLLLSSRKRLNGFSGWGLRRADEIFENTSRKGHLNEPLLSVTQERGVIPRDMLEGRVTMPSGETGAFKLVEPGNFVISLRLLQIG
jgi:type I restriction enzyme, S subunit